LPFAVSKLVRWVRETPPNAGVVWRYGVAVAAVIAATVIRLAFNPVLGVEAPHVSFALAVIAAAWFGGRGPGLAATLLSTLCADWFFVEPVHTFVIANPEDIWGLVLFAVTAVLIALPVGSLRESILARTRTEEALRQQVHLIDLSHDAVIVMDPERRVVKWNRGAEEMYGWSESEAVGKVLHHLLHSYSQIPIKEIDEILRRDGRWEGELIQTARDKRRLVVDSRQVLFGGGNGLPASILAISRNITARKQAEDALRASEARFEFVLEAAQVGAWDFDPASHTTWRSPQHDAIFGYPTLLPEWTYETFMDHVLPEDREEVGRSVAQALSTGSNLQYECRIRRTDGAVRWIWVQGRSQSDREGRPQRLSGIVRDVTENKRMEEDLRQSEDQFRTLANSIPNLCGVARPDGWFFWLNRRWHDYTGLTPEQSEGWGWLAAVDPKALPEISELWRHSVAAEEPFESVVPLRGADGIVRPFLARATPLRDREGELVRWFGTMTDISEQRKTEDALRKAHGEELARAIELEAIMDAVPVAMFVSRDPECRKVIGNRAAYELLREPPGSNLSKSAPAGERQPAFRILHQGRELAPGELPLQKAAATGQAVYDLELELEFEDGSRGNILGNAVPFLDAEGRSRGSVGVFVDITERKRNEEHLRQSQKLESIGLLAGGIAHDFNNLLTVIIGNADSALEEFPGSEQIQHVLTAAERAAELTRQLLAYAGKGQFVPKTFDLSGLVSRFTPLLASSIPKRVELVFHLSEQELLIQADPNQIEQILMNLVTNAAEAIPPQIDGRIEIVTTTCEVTAEIARKHAPAFDAQPGEFVCLEVRDNGLGMDEATLSHIFEPFFSTKFTGRGLGLPAVQGIVRSCNGFVEVHSSTSAGSLFRVFFPVAKRPAVEMPISPRPGAPRQRKRRQHTILVVDDEDMVRQLASTVLRSSGHQVLEAKNGKDALDVLAAAARPPSLVLVDLTMPAMGGEELVSILNQKYPGLSIIVTSGYPEEEARRAFAPGAVAGFLQKPYTVSTLTEIVETAGKSGGPDEEAPAAA